MKVNERFTWACEVINLKPTESVLEIGCGTGILVDLLSRNISSGKITAIDKSIPLIQKASIKNADGIQSGKIYFYAKDFLDTSFQMSEFDKIFSFNVNFLWENTTSEYELIKNYLKPAGYFFIFRQAPYEITIHAAQKPIKKLKETGFIIEDVILQPMKPFSSLCIIASH